MPLFSSAYEPSHALDRLAQERFIRICGLFDTFVPPPALHPTLVTRFQQARTAIARKIAGTSGDTALNIDGEVHSLNLLFLRTAPLPVLISFLHTLREDFREAVGDDAYTRYLQSTGYLATANPAPGCPETVLEAAVRADAIYLVNETTRQVRNQFHLEAVRRDHIAALKYGWQRLAYPLALLAAACLALTVVARHYSGHGEFGQWWIADWGQILASWFYEDRIVLGPQQVILATFVLAIAGFAGASGARVSYLMRLLGVAGSGQVTRNLNQFQNSITVARLTPLLGFAYGLLISVIFAARAISGTFFPDLDAEVDWFMVVTHHSDFAKWIIWAFLAGFSERLVPDMLDKIISRSQNALANVGAGGAGPAAGAGGNGHGAQANGAPQAGGAAPQQAGDPTSLLLVREDADTVRATWAPIAGAAKYRLSSGTDPAALSPMETRRTELVITPIPHTGTLTVKLEGLDDSGGVIPGPTVTLPLA